MGDLNDKVDMVNGQNGQLDAKRYVELLDTNVSVQHVSGPTHIKGHTLDHVMTREGDVCLIENMWAHKKA